MVVRMVRSHAYESHLQQNRCSISRCSRWCSNDCQWLQTWRIQLQNCRRGHVWKLHASAMLSLWHGSGQWRWHQNQALENQLEEMASTSTLGALSFLLKLISVLGSLPTLEAPPSWGSVFLATASEMPGPSGPWQANQQMLMQETRNAGEAQGGNAMHFTFSKLRCKITSCDAWLRQDALE